MALSTSEASVFTASECEDHRVIAEQADRLVEKVAQQLGRLRPTVAGVERRRSGGRRLTPRPYGWRVAAESGQRLRVRNSAAALRSILHAYGSLLRACRVPPERLVPPLRDVLRRAVRVVGIDQEQAISIVQEGVLWGIEGYYGDSL
jgi:hypothetical protein